MYRLVTQAADLAEVLQQLATEAQTEPLIALDVETYSSGVATVYSFSDPYTNLIRLVQLKSRNGQPVMIDLKAFADPDKLKPLWAFLQRADITWVGHNLKFDLKMLAVNTGVQLRRVYCTFIAGGMLGYATGMSARKSAGLGLKDIVRDLLKVDNLDKSEQKSYWGGELTAKQLEYAAKDVELLIPLYDKFVRMFREDYACEQAVDLEMRVLPATCRMELNGIALDLEMYRLVQECARLVIPKLLKTLCNYFGVPMQRTFDSTKRQFLWQPAKVNFKSNRDVMKLFRSKGIDTSDLQAETLRGFVDRFPIVQTYLDYAQLEKQLGVDYETYVHPITGRIHPTFNQMGAATGRYTCEKPNLQQVPKVDLPVPDSLLRKLGAEGKLHLLAPYEDSKRDGVFLNYRYCFVPRKGFQMLSADYSGQEVAVLVALSRDPFMISIMNKPKFLVNHDGSPKLDAKGKPIENLEADLHAQTAAMMFKIKPEQARDKPPEFHGKSYRDRSKAVTFGLAYGKSHVSLAEEWGVSEQEGKKTVNEFFKPMPTLRKWLDRQGQLGMDTRICRFGYGRLRFLNDLRHSDRKAADRAARNTPIQGTSALMMKEALIRMDQLAFEHPGQVYLIGSIHDEALSELHEDTLPSLLDKAKACMLEAADIFLSDGQGNILVKGDVGMGVGPTWTK